jgi:uncharacterized SAM-binding protein YcdF (DUF218 family)
LTNPNVKTQEGPPTWMRRMLAVVLFIAILGGLVLLSLRHLGNWLVVDDSLQQATSIAVFGGQVPFRAMEAAALYRKGWTHEVWLTREVPSSEDQALAQLGIDRASEYVYSRQVLQRLGVPPEAIRVLDEPVRNTVEEVRAIARELQRVHGDRVILITSKYHARRVKVLWHKLVGNHPEGVVRYTPDDPFDPDGWWRNTTDEMAVSREVFGLLNVWTGFPVSSERR